VAYIDTLVRSNKSDAEPPAIGFLAAAFQRYPNDIDRMIPAGLSVRMQGVVATALHFAGQDARANAMAGPLLANGVTPPDWRSMPASLESITVRGPSEFDLLWGASFATGDPRYCLRILEHYAAAADADGNADDMVNLVRTLGTHADTHWLVDKRGVDQARELIRQSTALWGLDSNARQHDFVRRAVGDYIRARPDEPASKALMALANAYGHYDLTKVMSVNSTGPGPPSVTVNISYLSAMLGDLERHAGSYPPQFQFADDRPRAEKDVQALSALLDPLSAKMANNAALQQRLALLHAVGFDLDIADSFQKAVAAYTALLALAPDDPQSNYQYGAFLTATTHDGRAIPYLEKARRLGVGNADYCLGLTYAKIGEKEKGHREPGTLHEGRAQRSECSPDPGRGAQRPDSRRGAQASMINRFAAAAESSRSGRTVSSKKAG